MSLIQVQFDPTITHTDIVMPLTHSSIDEVGEYYKENQQETQHTSAVGIMTPLIAINGVAIDITDVISFSLKSVDVMPETTITVRDRYKFISQLATPGVDNELRVQILPRFDGIYRKINLTFYITSIYFNDDIMHVEGKYKLPKFISSNIKSLGEMSTYKLFEHVAIDTGLGLASNIKNNESDKRYIYCDNKSYNDLLFKEIRRSGYDEVVFDYWIDWWNNLTLADIKERYYAKDSDEDMSIWVTSNNKEVAEGITQEPTKTVASLSNHPSSANTDLYVKSYHINNKPAAQMYLGTDKVYSIYEQPLAEYKDHFIQDGDTKNDIYAKYDYLGETYGEYNYLLSGAKRDALLQKIESNESIEVVISTPLLGIMRGSKVIFTWYDNDSILEANRNILQRVGLLVGGLLDDVIGGGDDGRFVIDKSVSGQYLVTGLEMTYNNLEWSYKLLLNRPTSEKPSLINK